MSWRQTGGEREEEMDSRGNLRIKTEKRDE